MKNKWWIILIVFITVIVVMIFVRNRETTSLISPNPSQPTSTPESSPTTIPSATPNIPKTYNFDSSTDLKKELESINPQVLDSDFE